MVELLDRVYHLQIEIFTKKNQTHLYTYFCLKVMKNDFYILNLAAHKENVHRTSAKLCRLICKL